MPCDQIRETSVETDYRTDLGSSQVVCSWTDTHIRIDSNADTTIPPFPAQSNLTPKPSELQLRFKSKPMHRLKRKTWRPHLMQKLKDLLQRYGAVVWKILVLQRTHQLQRIKTQPQPSCNAGDDSNKVHAAQHIFNIHKQAGRVKDWHLQSGEYKRWKSEWQPLWTPLTKLLSCGY